MDERKEALRVLLCYIVCLFGLYVVAAVLTTALHYYGYLDFFIGQGLIEMLMIQNTEFQIFPAIVCYLIGDGILILGSKIGGGYIRFPRYGSPVKTLIWRIILLVILPFYTAIKLAIELIKLLFSFLFALPSMLFGKKKNKRSKAAKKSVPSSPKQSTKPQGKSGGASKVRGKVAEICRRYERSNSKSFAAGTRSECVIKPSVFMNSVELSVQLNFSINTNYVNTDYDMQKEKDSIRSFIDRFPISSLQNDILSAIDGLQREYSDIYGEWRVACNITSDVTTV